MDTSLTEVELSECNIFNLSVFDETDESNFKRDKRVISFDMFGSCSLRNVKKIIRQNRVLKPIRLYLLRLVLDLCRSANLEVFAYGGTALSIFRENGKMIPHDSDIDLGVLEYDDAGIGAFKKLFLCCIKCGINFVGVADFNNFDFVRSDSEFYVNCFSSLRQKCWLECDSDSIDKVRELSYMGCDCKRAKFFLNDSGLVKACNLFNLNGKIVKQVLSDVGLVHIDLFTLSPHPGSIDGQELRVNWNLPGLYDCNRKKFPLNAIMPIKKSLFENVDLFVPADLYTYLSTEYGYLGRDAMFDVEKQLYVKIPEHLKSNLPLTFDR